MQQVQTNNVEGKLIFSPHVAKYLLYRGFRIIDIKPDKKIDNATVFVFERSDDLVRAIEKYREYKDVQNKRDI